MISTVQPSHSATITTDTEKWETPLGWQKYQTDSSLVLNLKQMKLQSEVMLLLLAVPPLAEFVQELSGKTY